MRWLDTNDGNSLQAAIPMQAAKQKQAPAPDQDEAALSSICSQWQTVFGNDGDNNEDTQAAAGCEPAADDSFARLTGGADCSTSGGSTGSPGTPPALILPATSLDSSGDL